MTVRILKGDCRKDRLGRNAILIELNSEYAAMAERRIKADAGMFAEVDA